MKPILSAAAVAARYQGVQVRTSSPAELLVMLYDGVLRFVAEARAALDKGDRARLGDRIGRALAIVDELAATLDPTHAPELADNLLALYGFCKRRLFAANIERDPQALADVTETIEPLREAWAELSAKG